MRYKISVLSIASIFIVLASLLLPFVFRQVLAITSYSYAIKILILVVHMFCLLGISFIVRSVLFDLYIELIKPATGTVIDIGFEKKHHKIIIFIVSLGLYVIALTEPIDYLGFSLLIISTQITFHTQKIVFNKDCAWYVDDYSLLLRRIIAYKKFKDDNVIIYMEDAKDLTFRFKKNRKSIQQSLIAKFTEYNMTERF